MARLTRKRTIEKELNGSSESPELYQWNRFLRYSNEIKRKHNDGNDSSVNSSDNEIINITDDEEQDHIDTKPNHKKRKIKTKAEEEFEANEKKLDEELPIDLRKYRPRGFRFNLPPEDRPIRIYADGVLIYFIWVI